MTMREKMAKSMAEKDGKHWAPMSEMFREAYYNHADAALAAMIDAAGLRLPPQRQDNKTI